MELDGDIKEFLIYTQKSAEHLLKTLNDILDLSKAETNKIKTIEKPYNLITPMQSSSFYNRGLTDWEKSCTRL